MAIEREVNVVVNLQPGDLSGLSKVKEQAKETAKAYADAMAAALSSSSETTKASEALAESIGSGSAAMRTMTADAKKLGSQLSGLTGVMQGASESQMMFIEALSDFTGVSGGVTSFMERLESLDEKVSSLADKAKTKAAERADAEVAATNKVIAAKNREKDAFLSAASIQEDAVQALIEAEELVARGTVMTVEEFEKWKASMTGLLNQATSLEQVVAIMNEIATQGAATASVYGDIDGLDLSQFTNSVATARAEVVGTDVNDAYLSYEFPNPIDVGRGFPGVFHLHFDTFNNAQGTQDPGRAEREPNANHLEVNYNSNSDASGWLTTQTLPFDINDGNWRSVGFQLTPTAQGAMLNLSVTEGGTTHEVVANLLIPDFDFDIDYRAALWADYGAAISLHDIDNIVIEAVNDLPEATVTGLNDTEISDGDNSASAADGTNFGTILKGDTPITQTFTVTNDGGSSLTLGSVSLPTGFTLTEGLDSTIAAGQSDTFTVRLDADVVGTKSGHLTFTTNDSDENPYNFRILGKVQEPIPAEIIVRGFNNVVIEDGDNKVTAADGTNFGSVLEDGTPKIQTFTVINLGDLPLTLGSVSVPTGFTLLDDLSGPLNYGESDTFTIQLDVDIVGTKSGHISFSNNDADESPFNFRITGKVIDVVHPEIRVNGLNGVEILDGDNKSTAADGTNFGSVAQGSTPVTRTFTVTNDGVDPLSLGVITIPNGFTLLEGLPSTLGVGQSDTFTVQLDTTTTGTKSGHLSFNTNDADERRFNFRILGKVL